MPRLTALLGALFLAGAALVLPAPAVQAAAGHQVLMSGYAFSPRTLTITAGDTVTWTNQDQAPHDVETTSGPSSVHSPMLSKGGSWSHTFTTPGTYGYVCTVHPDMTAQLVVQAAAAPAPTVPQHQHPTAAAPTTRPAATMPSSMHMDHSSEAAAPGAAKTPSPTASASAPSAAQPAVNPQNAASATRPLSPLLLLTGLVAGVAVLCLLLVGSRSAAAASRNDGPGTS